MKKFLSAVCLVALCGGIVNAAQCPSWQTSRNEFGVSWLILQSNDDIVIKGMTINRGNCAYVNKEYNKYGHGLDESKAVSEKHRQEIQANNKWRKNCKKNSKGDCMTMDKDGKEITKSYYYATTFGTSKKKTDFEEFFEKLDELSKGAFITNEYLIGKTLSFGEKTSFRIDCDYNDVIEVRLDTDLGECVMPRNR